MTTPDPSVAALKQEAIRRSRRRVLVNHPHRVRARSLCGFGVLGEFEVVVTGTELRAPQAKAVLSRPQVIRA